MRFWGNLLGYQTVWFCAVIGAAHGVVWPGLLSMALFALWQLYLSRQPGVELRLMAVALLCGLLIDGSLATSGFADYALPNLALPPGGAPLWILALWLSFALTVTQSLRYLQKYLWLAAVFGAVGGPVAYLGAARAFAVVQFQAPQWHALLLLALGWGLAMPLLAGLGRRWSARPKLDASSTTRSISGSSQLGFVIPGPRAAGNPESTGFHGIPGRKVDSGSTLRAVQNDGARELNIDTNQKQ